MCNVWLYGKIRATGMGKKRVLKKNLETRPRKNSIDSLPKTKYTGSITHNTESTAC
jgi:hypothetical protein